MKKNYFGYRPCLYLIAVLFMGCTQNLNTQQIYKPGREWIYQVSEFDSKGGLVDSFSFPLKVLEGTFFLQTQIQYSVTEHKPDGSKIETSETTGVAELEDKIWLHPFRSGSLRITELAPFPEIRLPAAIGKTWNSTITIGPGWKEWAGKKVENRYHITDTTSIRTPFRKFENAWKITGTGTSELGVYKVSHYFHDKYGFVATHYQKPSGEKVFVELKEVNF
ncbi:hypothetical protein [Adhaeribacter soli]|uniref:Lipoprotein n=1 Tax=Adhaeribacter soli TaxID=2607655 RepID=A0A5N1IQ25_9BACT|nr:hypothetical protein [Adhaeribacter soli]KAA9331977.1 hypothetical protein F0P94_14380 [Adhaeribacter soli]